MAAQKAAGIEEPVIADASSIFWFFVILNMIPSSGLGGLSHTLR